MAMKADWYVLPEEFVAASGTVNGGSSEIRVLQNRIILAHDKNSRVDVYSMKNIAAVALYWNNGQWVIELRDCSDHYQYVYLGTNWEWANKLYHQIQYRL